MKQYILAIDQGTTGSTVLVIDRALSIRGRHTEEFAQIYPQPGWVEHDPEAILASVGRSVERALAAAGVQTEEIAGIGITNQRETTVVWDRQTGRAIHNAIVWQDRRTTSRCQELRAEGYDALFRRTHRPGARPLLLRHQDRVAAGQRGRRARPGKQGRARLRDHRLVFGVAPHRWRGPRDGRLEREPHAAPGPAHPALGRGPVRPAARADGGAPRGPQLQRGLRHDPGLPRPAGRHPRVRHGR
jgi:hypothetical protein